MMFDYLLVALKMFQVHRMCYILYLIYMIKTMFWNCRVHNMGNCFCKDESLIHRLSRTGQADLGYSILQITYISNPYFYLLPWCIYPKKWSKQYSWFKRVLSYIWCNTPLPYSISELINQWCITLMVYFYSLGSFSRSLIRYNRYLLYTRRLWQRDWLYPLGLY